MKALARIPNDVGLSSRTDHVLNEFRWWNRFDRMEWVDRCYWTAASDAISLLFYYFYQNLLL